MHDRPADRRIMFAALRHRDFRLFWIGIVLSSFGTNFTQIAMQWQMYEMTGSPLQLGLLGLVRAVPSMIVLLFGGLLADAMDRRRLMMRTQVAQLVISLAILALALADGLSPLVFYVASALLGLFSSLESPARNAIVPNMVPPVDLMNALALNSSQRSISLIAGPPLAGVLLAAFGPSANYAVNAACWVAMVGILLAIKPVPQEIPGRRAVSMDALREGFSYVWTHPLLLAVMLLDFGQNIFGNGRALLPIYASDILGVGPQGFGVLSAANSVGGLVATGVMSAYGRVRRAGLGVLVTILIYGVTSAVFAFSEVFWLSAAMLMVQGAANGVSTVLRTTILQLNIPDALRGRVTSVNQVFTNGGPQLGVFRVGAMGQWIGPELSIFVGAAALIGMVGVVGVGVPMVRRFEIVEDPASYDSSTRRPSTAE